MNIIELENQLDDMIALDPDFGKWYFSKEKHFTMLPDEAYKKYNQLVDDGRARHLKDIFKIKMTMRKNGWSDEYLHNEITMIRESVTEQYKDQPQVLHGFGDNDYVRYFNGNTDYLEARATIQRYNDACNFDVISAILN